MNNLKRKLFSREVKNQIFSFFRFIPDEIYLKILYRLRMGKRLNLDNPQTFNEKLQWLKLYDRKPIYTTMVDKFEAKKYVASIIGEEYIIPTLGVWERFEDIDFNQLPDQFVLKCTHDSGGLVICRDKSSLDIEAARKKIKSSLKTNYYWVFREWPYKNVYPRIIAEQYLEDESKTELKDYKVFNFDGEPKLIEIDFDRFFSHKRNIYTTDWELINMAIQYPTDPNRNFDKPTVLEEIIDLSRKLSASIPHLRTDFYCIGDRILFGELTFYHESGFGKFSSPEWDYILGSWIKTP